VTEARSYAQRSRRPPRVGSGVTSATFTIGAADAVDAAELGVQAFRAALGASGLAPGERTAITVELVPIANAVQV
jgi:hypothetical protein